MHFVIVLCTSSNRLLLSNQDKGCTPSVAHPLALPLRSALHNVSSVVLSLRLTFFKPVDLFVCLSLLLVFFFFFFFFFF